MKTSPEVRATLRALAENHEEVRLPSDYLLALLDRLAEVEAERDGALREHAARVDSLQHYATRAARAEAALDRVKALADEWASEARDHDGRYGFPPLLTASKAASDLRAAIGGDQ